MWPWLSAALPACFTPKVLELHRTCFAPGTLLEAVPGKAGTSTEGTLSSAGWMAEEGYLVMGALGKARL